jgi:hypothetical protein
MGVRTRNGKWSTLSRWKRCLRYFWSALPSVPRPGVANGAFSRGHETAIGQYDIGFQQIIKSQTIFPRQIAGSTTEGEPSDSCGRNDSNRDS